VAWPLCLRGITRDRDRCPFRSSRESHIDRQQQQQRHRAAAETTNADYKGRTAELEKVPYAESPQIPLKNEKKQEKKKKSKRYKRQSSKH